MEGLNVLVTGSTCGLGLHTAKILFKKGANVILTCRDEIRGRHAVESLLSGVSQEQSQKEAERIHLFTLDVTNYNSICNFTDEISRMFKYLHVIINNAGIMGMPFELSVDGIEMHFATNVFGHYVVVERLLPLLLKTDRPDFKSRVIVVSSGLYRNAEAIPQVSKLLGQKTYDYSPKQAYAFSKLANCLYTGALSKMLEPHNVGVYCVRPGFVNGTELGRETHWILRALAAPIIWFIAKTLEQGCETIVYLAETSGNQLKNGSMYYERKEEAYNEMVEVTSIRQVWAILRHLEDTVWKRNTQMTDEQRNHGEMVRELLNESLIV
ncbi:Retinol dehydrogenase 12-like [Caenorhabditis elegans]|uniref:Retinol dehydrogenase 12-like n=1 Tax=Caenorhabditis elegans TaxID=6239 RepID=P91013_CAEEL|nr:Retinol dehydrogenase 12-like [Caenorhabditis elegans]CCD62460.1 Retinol dehydrogenase 12-like [Caenorhabditis elegans]|eukprot:NP_491557.1 DeHydrogenases, Short chain [Caenorhabditis elegans]